MDNYSKNKGENNPNYKHGGKGSKLYNVHHNIKQRCLNPKVKYYKNYGGRGITVCNEWIDKEKGFINFRDWALSNGYQEGLEIDRIDNNGNYEPSNCNFITSAKNCQNKRNNKLTMEIANKIRYLWNTGKYTQSILAEKYEVHQTLISLIIYNKIWRNL